MSAVRVWWLEGERTRSGDLRSLDDASGAQRVWVDLSEPDEETFAELARHFPLHPLAIEDCLHYPQRSKLDVYPESLFCVWHDLAAEDDLTAREVDFFLGASWLITVHREPSAALELVAADVSENLSHGTDWTMHGILDRIVDDMFPLVDSIGDRLEELEDEVVEAATPAHVEELHSIRRQLLGIRKVIGPERDVLRSIAREEHLVNEEAYRYFADIGDHLARVQDTIETLRDIAASVMDIYLSAASNRMNAIMKQLTVVATIFMPLTLITGIYGMNFQNMPELRWQYGYFMVLGGMLLIAAGMLYIFRRRNWW